MSADEELILRGNEVFEIEVRGFDHTPEAERNMTLRHVDHFWVGNSLNLFSFALRIDRRHSGAQSVAGACRLHSR